MKKDQKHLPKYWVCHHPLKDDVLISTAHKSKSDSQDVAVHFSKCAIGGNPSTTWEDLEDQGWKCDLVELKMLEVDCGIG